VTVTEFTDSTFTTPTAVAVYAGNGVLERRQPLRHTAAPAAPAATADGEQLDTSVTITVTEYGAKGFTGKPIGEASYAGNGALLSSWGKVKGQLRTPSVRAAKTLDGGKPSASGCHRVEVENTAHNLIPTTAYTLKTWTDTCWNRAAGLASAQTNDYSLYADSQHQWADGWLIYDGLYYDWGPNNSEPDSAFRFRAQKRIDNCLLKVGCVGSHYPLNIIRTYKDGTFQVEWDG
jgi:hypothetical protein